MTTWGELVKNRTPLPRIFDSAQLIECIAWVRSQYPDADCEQTGDRKWILFSEDQALSTEHNNQTDCWLEAREIIRGTGK